MATYKGIQGFTIQNLSADPSNPIEGQVWYNSTSNVWKVEEATTAGAWATGNNMNTARRALAGRYANCSFSFWWRCSRCYSSNRRIRWNKLGYKSNRFKYGKTRISRSWYSNCSFRFWWLWYSCYRSNRRI
jgi:hypothetical protein